MSAGQKKLSTGTNPLLHSKMMPPRLHANVIRRENLFTRLDDGLSRKLIVVNAPAGFGKTTLVVSWLSSRSPASAWLTLDQYDNDPTRFWTYFVSAIRTLNSSIGRETLSLLMAPQPVSFQNFLTPLINDLAHFSNPSVLVLEDFQFIRSSEILDAVSFLIQHLPDSLHLVLITRSEPGLSLPLLRVRNDMVEIDARDLRLNHEEVQAFLKQETQVEFSPLEVSQLVQKTEGWAAGLRLIAMSLQNKNRPADLGALGKSVSGQDRYVADYLIQEVFQSQSENIQWFLLQTCFINRLTASLCDAITETRNSTLLLEQLDRQNLFLVQLERSNEQTWYRYNPMFAESIQYLARQQLEETNIQAIFERASQWYEYHGLLENAVEMALSARLLDRAMELIDRFIDIHDLSEMNTLERWLERIPPQTIQLHPTICFTYAQVLLYSRDRFAAATAADIEPYLRTAEAFWQKVGDHEKLGQLFSFRGNVSWWQADFEKAFQYARRALERLPEHSVFWRGNSLLMIGYEALQAGQIRDAQDYVLEARALLGAAQNQFGVLAAIQILGEVFYWQGELEQAVQLNQQILAEAVGHESMLDDQGIASLSLARIAYERNDLEAADQHARRALDLARQRANQTLEVQATIQLALLYAAKGDFSQARDSLKSLEAKTQNSMQLREIQNVQSSLSIRVHDLSNLEWWVKMIAAETEGFLDLQREREAFTLARLRIAENRPADAIDLLAKWKDLASDNGRLRSQVEALCLEALALSAAAKDKEAAKVLSEALAIGYPKEFRRIFLDEGPRMAGLLQTTLALLPSRSLRLFVSTLLQSFGSDASSSTPELSIQLEALSAQEVRVLRLLVAGLSNTDIARELVVSTNTIKTHLKNIYRKLSVNSREEAREVARELKLV